MDLLAQIDWKALSKVNTTFEFDELFTFKVHKGASNPKDYYKLLSCYEEVEKVTQPVLVLQSENDFCVPLDLVPFEKFAEKDNFFYVGVPRGGHMEYFTKFSVQRVR